MNNAQLQTEVSSMDQMLAPTWIEPEELERPSGKKQRKEGCDVGWDDTTPAAFHTGLVGHTKDPDLEAEIVGWLQAY